MATTIKVDRLVLLDALTTKLAEQEALQDSHDKAIKAYEKALNSWHDKVVSVVKKLEVQSINVRTWNKHVELNYIIPSDIMPDEPEKPDYPRGLISDLDELRKTIKLLGMTTEPHVPASVYKSVANWL